MEKIKIIEDFFNKLEVPLDSVEKKDSCLEGSVRYVINTKEAALLIGNKGETLNALGHILKRIIEKNLSNDTESFFIDIGDYQDKKIQEIKNKALMFGERARFFKKDVELPPMGAYERMIIHSTFSNSLDLETESFGRGLERRIVIKYKGP
jgi:spoIIIJ-associated protein